MAISTTTNRIVYLGDGATTGFPYPFRIFDDTDLVVTEVLIASPFTETVKTLTTDYTVSGAGDATGGTVTMVTAPASTVKLVIERSVPFTQGVTFVDNEVEPADTTNDALDKLTMLTQQLLDVQDRTVRLDITQDPALINTSLPPPEADKALTWNSDGTALINVTNPGAAADAAAESAAEAAASEAAAASSASDSASSASAASSSASAAAASAASVVVDDDTLEKTTDIHIKDLGVDTAQIAALAVTEEKIEVATIATIRENHVKTNDAISFMGCLSKAVAHETNTILLTGDFRNKWVIFSGYFFSSGGIADVSAKLPGGTNDAESLGETWRVAGEATTPVFGFAGIITAAMKNDAVSTFFGRFYTESGVSAPATDEAWSQATPEGVCVVTGDAANTFSKDCFLYVDSSTHNLMLHIGTTTIGFVGFSIFVTVLANTAL